MVVFCIILWQEFQTKISSCRDKAGNIVGEKESIMERWAEYFSELLNKRGEGWREDPIEQNGHPNEDMVEIPSIME